jgi:anti-sigma factor RsiW
METNDILNLQAYVDGEAPSSEKRHVEGLIARSAEARQWVEELRFTREAVRANEPQVSCPESRDFYWSKIARQIEREERESALARTSVPRWVLRYLMPVAGVSVLIAVLAFLNRNALLGDTAETGEAGLPEASSVVFRSQAEGMTVVWLQNTADDSVFTPFSSEDNL